MNFFSISSEALLPGPLLPLELVDDGLVLPTLLLFDYLSAFALWLPLHSRHIHSLQPLEKEPLLEADIRYPLLLFSFSN